MDPASSFKLVTAIADSGSPRVLHAVGRVFGLGEQERAALVNGNVPKWFWITATLAIGFVAGVQIYKRWPNAVPAIIKGKK